MSPETWESFFLGQLGATAALAGLLFVAVSINVDRIVRIPGLADRGFEVLLTLLGVLTLSALMLVPGQSPTAAGIEVLDPFHLPLYNTIILLLSGTTVTWAHHALLHDDRKGLVWGLALTVALGVLFSVVQVYEYMHAPFAFSDSIYGATFFMATGFHGFHVFVGTIFLLVCLFRAMAGGFTPKQHFGFEAAAWYWHFVDVVWLFLFAAVYVWASAGATIAAGH